MQEEVKHCENESKANKQESQLQKLSASWDGSQILPTISIKINNARQEEIALMELIYENQFDKIKQMLSNHGGSSNYKQMQVNFLIEFKNNQLDKCISPLILSCYMGRLDIVKYFLKNLEVSLNLATNPLGFTPLQVACLSGFYDIVKSLLKQSMIDVNQKNQQGLNALWYCFQRLNEQDNQFENKRLCMKLASLLLQYGASIDEIIDQKKNYTLLMHFCSLKNEYTNKEKQKIVQVVKFLIENGANIYHKSYKGYNCIDISQKKSKFNSELQTLFQTCKQINYYDSSLDIKDKQSQNQKSIPNSILNSTMQNELIMQNEEFEPGTNYCNITKCCSTIK